MAKGKSKSFKWLTTHIVVYTLPLIPIGLKWALFNGAAHWCVDAVTSRVSSKMWAQGRVHDFFVVIGFDQLIHVVCLLASYHWMVGTFGI